MWWATANLEKALDVDKETDLIQLSDTFEKTFESYTNRDILVKAAKENFATFDEATKEQLKNTSADEIASWGKYPETSDKWYNAKIWVLYLYTTLQQNKTNATLVDTKNAYTDLITSIENKIEPMETLKPTTIEHPTISNVIPNNIKTTTWTDIEKPIINQNEKIVLDSVENPITIPIIPETNTTPEPTKKEIRQNKKIERTERKINKEEEKMEEKLENELDRQEEDKRDEEDKQAEKKQAELEKKRDEEDKAKEATNTPEATTKETRIEKRTERQEDRKNKRTERIETRQEKNTEHTEDNLNEKNTVEIEKNKLPDDLQKISLEGDWTQQWENYIFTPTDKKNIKELRDDNNKGLRKFENQYEVDYFGKENNPSIPVDYVIFSPIKDLEETNTTEDPEAINTIEDPKWKNSKMFTVTGIDLSYTKTKAEENAKTRLANYLWVDRKTVAYRDTYEEDSTKSKTYQLSDGSYKRDLVIKFNKKEDLPT